MDNISILVLKQEHINEAAQCLARNFLREPMIQAVNLDLEEMLEFSKLVVNQCAQYGLSFIIKDAEIDEIIGVMVNNDFLMPFFDESAVFSEKLYPVLELLDVCENYYRQHNEVNVGEVLSMMMMAIDADARISGLSSQFVSATLNMAGAKGFKKIVSELTGVITQHVFVDKFNFTELYAVNYSEYTFADEHVFKDITSSAACKLVHKEIEL